MNIKKILLKRDFSKDSLPHKERLKRELTGPVISLAEPELLSVAAAGQGVENRQPVTPAALCVYGVKSTPCGGGENNQGCEYLSPENGVWYCKYNV